MGMDTDMGRSCSKAARPRGRTCGQRPKLGPQAKLAQQMYDELDGAGMRK
jgi:hypothetical protein